MPTLWSSSVSRRNASPLARMFKRSRPPTGSLGKPANGMSRIEGKGPSRLRWLLPAFAVSFCRPRDIRLKGNLHALRDEQAIRQMFQHQPIHSRHGDTTPWTGGLTFLGTTRTRIVLVPPTLFGTQRHPEPARGAPIRCKTPAARSPALPERSAWHFPGSDIRRSCRGSDVSDCQLCRPGTLRWPGWSEQRFGTDGPTRPPRCSPHPSFAYLPFHLFM